MMDVGGIEGRMRRQQLERRGASWVLACCVVQLLESSLHTAMSCMNWRKRVKNDKVSEDAGAASSLSFCRGSRGLVFVGAQPTPYVRLLSLSKREAR